MTAGRGENICVCFYCGWAGRANGPGQSVPSPASTTTPDIHPLTHRLDPFLAIYLQRSLLPYTRHPTWLHHPLHPPSSPQPSRPHHHKNILYLFIRVGVCKDNCTIRLDISKRIKNVGQRRWVDVGWFCRKASQYQDLSERNNNCTKVGSINAPTIREK